jgi:adenylate kinase family enzyme
MALVILTGASGSGKTAIAKSIAENYPAITVFRFDSVGVSSSEELASFGNDHMPGGTWMRDTTFKWMERIATVLSEGETCAV